MILFMDCLAFQYSCSLGLFRMHYDFVVSLIFSNTLIMKSLPLSFLCVSHLSIPSSTIMRTTAFDGSNCPVWESRARWTKSVFIHHGMHFVRKAAHIGPTSSCIMALRFATFSQKTDSP